MPQRFLPKAKHRVRRIRMVQRLLQEHPVRRLSQGGLRPERKALQPQRFLLMILVLKRQLQPQLRLQKVLKVPLSLTNRKRKKGIRQLMRLLRLGVQKIQNRKVKRKKQHVLRS